MPLLNPQLHYAKSISKRRLTNSQNTYMQPILIIFYTTKSLIEIIISFLMRRVAIFLFTLFLNFHFKERIFLLYYSDFHYKYFILVNVDRLVNEQ